LEGVGRDNWGAIGFQRELRCANDGIGKNWHLTHEDRIFAVKVSRHAVNKVNRLLLVNDGVDGSIGREVNPSDDWLTGNDDGAKAHAEGLSGYQNADSSIIFISLSVGIGLERQWQYKLERATGARHRHTPLPGNDEGEREEKGNKDHAGVCASCKAIGDAPRTTPGWSGGMGRQNSRGVRGWTQHRQMNRDLDVGRDERVRKTALSPFRSSHSSLTCPSFRLISASHVVTLLTNFLRKLEQTANLLD
jgi:hypothetical protein